jgi:hypothetical protein
LDLERRGKGEKEREEGRKDSLDSRQDWLSFSD